MKSSIISAAIAMLFVSGIAGAQPLPNPNTQLYVERWNNLWLTVTNNGYAGGEGHGFHWDTDPCPQWVDGASAEFPGGSGQHYIGYAALWIGAIIDSSGYQTPRVSVGTDGWSNPSINEFWPQDEPGGAIVERSNRDTMNCFGDPIYNPYARADHEYISIFTDTLVSEFWNGEDPIDGPHRPLGIEVSRTTYALTNSPCSNILWIRYRIWNILQYLLRDLYLGYSVGSETYAIEDPLDSYDDDLCGFEPTEQIAYFLDNDGRRHSDASGNDFVLPNVVGIRFLRSPVGPERISYNWWVSNGNLDYDYGPSWEAYAERDSLDLGWTDLIGTPMGDLHKYQLMGNGEQDFDQVRVNNPSWITTHPQSGQAWSTNHLPENAVDVANGYYTHALLSFGPLGTPNGDHTVLMPGDSVEVWIAIVGGLDFHDPEHPQPTNQVIDPNLFDLSDLIANAQTAQAGACFDWASGIPTVAPTIANRFSLDPVYPNPFNGTARIRFYSDREQHVSIRLFDLLGREVYTIAEGVFATGSHEFLLDGENLAAGLYFVRAAGGKTSLVQKALLLK